MEILVRLSPLEHCFLQNMLEMEAAEIELDLLNSSPGALREVAKEQRALVQGLEQKLERAPRSALPVQDAKLE